MENDDWMDDDWIRAHLRAGTDDFHQAREEACVERIRQALEEVRSDFPDHLNEFTIADALMEETNGKRKYDLGTLADILQDAVDWDKQLAQEEEEERLRKLREHYGSP